MLQRRRGLTKPFSSAASAVERDSARIMQGWAVFSVPMKTDPRVDAYLAKAPPFAQPILQEARQRVRKAFADVEETIKWNVPFFILGGKIIASMAAFKKHVKVGVWVGETPTFQDVIRLDELTAPKEFAAQLKAAADASPRAMNSRSAPARAVSKLGRSAGTKPKARKAGETAVAKSSTSRAPKAPTAKARAAKSPGKKSAKRS